MNGSRGLVIATAAAFIVGCAVGLIGGLLFVHFVAPRLHGRPEFGMARGPGPGRPGGRERLLTEMDQTLSLTPDQHQRVLADLDRARREQVAVRESVHVWIERELNPDQRERWKQMEERFARARRARWSRGAMPDSR